MENIGGVNAFTSRLTVSRTSPKDVRHRQVIVSLDNEPFATLMFGQSKSQPVPPGRHRLRVYNTLVWKIVDFDLKDDEHVTFELVNRPGRWTYLLVSLLGVGPLYLDVNQTSATASR